MPTRSSIIHQICSVARLALLLSIGFSSCKKLVSISQPQNTVTTTSLFTNDVQAASSLAGLYDQLILGGISYSNGGMSVYTGLSSDELTNRAAASGPFDAQFLNNKLTNSNGQTDLIFWNPAYKTIYIANAILDGVAASTSPGLSDSARRRLTGEALFTRSFAYFYLTNLFGDVPLPLTTDFNKTALLSRAPQASVYKQMIADLNTAIPLLPVDFSAANAERTHPNQWAVRAMLARIYLYQRNWQQADSMANAIIGNPLFSLSDNLSEVFGKNNPESVWQLQPSTSISPYGPTEITYFEPVLPWATWILPPFDSVLLSDISQYNGYVDQLVPNCYLSQQLVAAFEPGDQRKTAWTGYTPTPNAPPSYNGDTLLWPNKYVPATAGVASTQYYTVFRLAELYLIRAEAKIEEKDLVAAATDINLIRARAGLPPTLATDANGLLAAVMQERRIEFFAEWGHRWLDLKRTGTAATVLGAISIKQPWKNDQLLYPIPINELQTDPNLTQNPGY